MTTGAGLKKNEQKNFIRAVAVVKKQFSMLPSFLPHNKKNAHKIALLFSRALFSPADPGSGSVAEQLPLFFFHNEQ